MTSPYYADQVAKAIANIAQSQTDAELVAAISGYKIVVLDAVTQAGGTATTLTFNSKGSGSGTAISPLFANGANVPNPLPFNQYGWFETNTGEALTVTTGAGSTTGILVTWASVAVAGQGILNLANGLPLTLSNGNHLLL